MSNKDEGKLISITTLPITTPKEEAFGCAVDDRTLIDAICKYSKVLRDEGVEVFSREKNVIATEKGYFFAWYDEDLRNMEGGIDNPTPYKGNDGRLKIVVVAEDGRHTEEDLATLVAMAYVPNLGKYKKVWFKDADKLNVVADNLYWVSWFEYFILNTLHKIGIKIKNK